MDSILDSLQVVQTLDNDIEQQNKKHPLWQTQNLNSSSDQNQSNTNLKVSSSTKPSIYLSSSLSHKQKAKGSKKLTLSKSSFKQENQNEKQEKQTVSNNLRKLNVNDQFSCHNCSHQFNSNCEICKGKTRVNGNDKMIKFFEYILEFKLGKNQSYRPKQEKQLSRRNNPNEHCNMYFSTVNPKISVDDRPQAKVRFSVNNDVFRSDSIVERDDQIKCKEVHNGFNCDQCEMDPIRGLRYHCNQCQDFDLCQECFLRMGHLHDLQKIEPKANKRALQIVNQLLKNGNASNLKSSLRNSSSFRSSLGNKTYKSWIR